MTMAEYTEQLQIQLKEHASHLAREQQDRVVFNGNMVSYMERLMTDLRQYTYQYTFSSPQEEILFFKDQKPVLLSQYFFYRKSLSICLCDSYKDNEEKKIYYKAVLGRLAAFQKRYNRFHLYCITGQTHFDEIYFTRNTTSFQSGIDPKFSTGYDIKLAKLLANELLRTDLSLSIEKLSATAKSSSINWTGKKSDAVELLFALQASDSINHGETEVKKLIMEFERFFNISLGNYYDFIKKIRMRKGNKPNYLDVLRAKLLQRLSEMDE